MLRILAAGLASLALAACNPAGDGKQGEGSKQKQAERMVAPVLPTPEAKDVSSFAEPRVARVTHVTLDLRADFPTRRMVGTATLDIEAAPSAKEIVLDSKGLEIASVTDIAGNPLQWGLGLANPDLGQPLRIALGGAKRIRIAYRSAPDAEALQWLAPEQTAGKRYPFLFSQGQPILNRTWIPTQDSPGIRQTWEARIVRSEERRVGKECRSRLSPYH